MHYIGISLIRAEPYYIKNISKLNSIAKCENNMEGKFELAGICKVRFKGEMAWLNFRKGVVCSKNFSDWGVRIKVDKDLYESGVVPFNGNICFQKKEFRVNLTKYNEFLPTFIKLSIIKILAFFFGAKLIGILKKRAINRSENIAIMSFDEEKGINLISTEFYKFKNIFCF